MSKALSTKNLLSQLGSQLKESVGVREEETKPQLSPVASPRDVGRRANRKFGRVEVARVIADPQQPRTEFDADELSELVESIRTKGQLQPIRVRWSEPDSAWMIISGERRWRASQAAGLQFVDCYFHDDGMTRTEILEEQLIENMVRADLKPVEEARSFEELMQLNGYSMRDLAKALSVNPSRVSRAMALLRLPQEIQQQVDEGELSARAGYELSKLESPAEQTKALRSAGGKMTPKEASDYVKKQVAGAKAIIRSTKKTFVFEDGWKVTVTHQKKGSYDEIAAALENALQEVRHRIDNDVSM